MEWKVPTPPRSRMPILLRRVRSSFAARRVKVRARTRRASAVPSCTRRAIRLVRTRVFPAPGPARILKGCSSQLTAACCSLLKASRISVGALVGEVGEPIASASLDSVIQRTLLPGWDRGSVASTLRPCCVYSETLLRLLSDHGVNDSGSEPSS